ncbi:hypothetical protein HCDG_08678 [Histoplasma capsulatum H143]|uniref:Uncharacterized protein n=1 Tax=Ajellomyces capsulatus (strain H143) TaxID=544712 RepID=C6HRU3_AJECH|nr:hypothetical protein HCDG_08678 [Histoplasma capsulatum H143]
MPTMPTRPQAPNGPSIPSHQQDYFQIRTEPGDKRSENACNTYHECFSGWRPPSPANCIMDVGPQRDEGLGASETSRGLPSPVCGCYFGLELLDFKP